MLANYVYLKTDPSVTFQVLFWNIYKIENYFHELSGVKKSLEQMSSLTLERWSVKSSISSKTTKKRK